MPQPKAVGIDLGTTFSVTAWVNPQGRSEIIPNAEGDLLTPSVVLFDDAEVIVGKEARSALGVHPDRVAEWVKRDMGAPVYSHPVRGEHLPPEVIQSCILRKLRSSITNTLGPDTRVVITVPAYFDEPRRKATADAGEMAGLSLLDIVNEPTAAALSFAEALGFLSPQGTATEAMTVLVYDLGGGTFDATLLRIAPGEIRALATDGDVQLGGHDWDLRLVDCVAEQFHEIHDLDPRRDLSAFHRLYQEVLNAKHTLSARNRAVVHFEYSGFSADIPLTRELFEQRTADLLERTAYTTRQLVATAQIDWSDVSRILLVGGATRMPMVQRMLTELTGKTPDHTVNPDEAVARGAALYAHYLLQKQSQQTGGPKPVFEVVNVNAHSLGIEAVEPQTLRKTNVVLMPRNTPLPATVTERFTTKQQGQRSIIIRILEGESTVPDECSTIGRTSLRELPPSLPQGWPIDVTFQYATNGRLSVHTAVPGTDRHLSLQLQREVGLSDESMSRWQQAVSSLAGFDVFESMLDSDSPGQEADAELLPLSQAPDQPGPAQPSPAQPDTVQPPPLAPVDRPEDEAAPQPPSPTQPPSKHSLGIVDILGYILSTVIGLVLGYVIISWLFPQSDFLRWFR